MPIIEKYQKLGLVKTISATPNPDEVSADLGIFHRHLTYHISLLLFLSLWTKQM